MKSHLSHTLLRIVQRVVDAPENTLSKVASRFSTELPQVNAAAPPEHVMTRLENAFEALSELAFQPDISAALDLACDTLQSELPADAIVAGVYDINADEIRILAARGSERDLLRGTVLPSDRCFAGHTGEEPFVVGDTDWLGSGEYGAGVLLCPIVHDARLLGVIGVADPLCTARFAEHDLELVSYVAGQLASFIHTQRQLPSLLPPPSAPAD